MIIAISKLRFDDDLLMCYNEFHKDYHLRLFHTEI